MDLLFPLYFSAAILFLGMHRGNCVDIVGGRQSVPHSRPFMALIYGSQYCGGTLIKDNWVLTAAHCKITHKTSVILGAHSTFKPEKEKQKFQIGRVVRHPDYNPVLLLHDIMLLQLHGKARLNDNVQTIKLPQTFEDVRVGTLCLAAGWGKTEKGEPVSDTLREVNLTVKDRDFCKRQYHVPGTIHMMCASGVKNEWKGTCVGDSGGPLICGGIQRGITSFGNPRQCGSPKYPSVFTCLTQDYIKWINDIIQE